MSHDAAQVPNCPRCGQPGRHDLLRLAGCFVKTCWTCPQQHHWDPATGEEVVDQHAGLVHPPIEVPNDDWVAPPGWYDVPRSSGGPDA